VGVTHSCLGCQIDHQLEAFFGKQCCHRFLLFGSAANKTETGKILQLLEPIPFQLRIVIIVQVVQADDRMPLLQEALGQVESYESGGAGYQNLFHVR